MTSTQRYVQISSKFRTNPNDPPGNCKIEMPQILKQGAYRLAYVLIPNTFYTVNPSNNTFVINEGGADITVTLVDGFFDNRTFPVMLKERLDVSGTQIYTVTLSPVTNKITISAVGAFSLSFTKSESTAHTLIGFNKSDYASAVSQVAPNLINLSPIHTINISINEISMISQQNLQGTTFMIPVPAGSLSYINYIPPVEFNQIVEFQTNQRVLSCVMRDELHTAIDLNGVDFLIVLERIIEPSSDDSDDSDNKVSNVTNYPHYGLFKAS